MKIQTLFFILGLATPLICSAEEEAIPPPNLQNMQASPPVVYHRTGNGSLSAEGALWYRDAGEYLTSRSTRMGFPTDVNTKVITDAKRYDVGLGKRIPLLVWDDESLSDAWVVGVDGGMLASLTKYSRAGKLTFATNNFDGYFGAFIERGFDGWLFMFRMAHLSAHLVDNSPQILAPVSYSQFWNEIIVGKTFPEPETKSNWDLHLQGSLGLNNTSSPIAKQPRASAGVSAAYAPGGPDRLAFILSGDALNAGVQGQEATYATFLGFGTLNRPNTTHRPFRAGMAYYFGTDYRNQFYYRKQDWFTFEISTEL